MIVYIVNRDWKATNDNYKNITQKVNFKLGEIKANASFLHHMQKTIGERVGHVILSLMYVDVIKGNDMCRCRRKLMTSSVVTEGNDASGEK